MERSSQRPRSSTKIDKNIAGLYDFEKTLGSGHFAVVKLARHVFTGEKVAVKVIDKTKLDEVSRAHLYQEVRCMKLVQHPNVVRLYEVVDTPTKLYLILEFGDGGDMYDHIMKHEGHGISEEKAKHYFGQIVSAIDYCHKLHVVHRDLKPENVIFFKSQDVAKLTDFGFSNNFSPGEKLSTSCGSLAYSAPEILLGDSYEPPAVDVWSLGVILYMMVCGTGPFSHTNDSETLTKIMDCKYHVPDHLSAECALLISKMLVREPSKRATLKSIYYDPWLQSASEGKSNSPEPLVSDIRVTPDLHMLILQRMESGSIAPREEIQRSLEEDKYDHITATYFLIAERLLKKKYGSSAFHLKLEARRSCPCDETRSQSDPNLLDVENEEEQNGSSSPELRSAAHHTTWSSGRRGSMPKSVDDMADIMPSETVLNEDNTAYTTEFAPRSLNIAPRSHRMTYPNSLIKNTLSSPNLLNEISEENESDFEDSPKNSPRNSRRPLRRQQKYEKKRTGCRLSPIHSRRSSCSSSDDEDLQKLDRRLNIQVGIGTARVLPHAPQNSGGGGGDKKETTSGGKDCGQSNQLAMLLLGDDKENNYLNFSTQNKIFVTSVNGRVRNLSDTNLVSYQARYGFDILKATKSSSDTNLAISVLNSQSLLQSTESMKLSLKRLQFSSHTTPSLTNSTPIEEENPADISPLSSPVAKSEDEELSVLKIDEEEEFSSIQENETDENMRLACSRLRKESGQSATGSKNSLKYLYNELSCNDEVSCYTIDESRPLENENTSSKPVQLVNKSYIHGFKVGKVFVLGPPIHSKCCNIL